MNGRLKLIEQKLLGIDSASFQNLCDVYLSMREQKLVSINRTGSQLGKQKTVKGTPDTFFRLADGSLRYVEYTTKADGLVEKITGDIESCLDEYKTGVPASEVHKIIICHNSRLNVADEIAITKYAISKRISIELIGLDTLALEIYSKYLILAKDILGIPLDSGQLMPIQSFIDEYNNKAGKLSTPLDNAFLHRKDELKSIGDILSSNDILIISGFPGVGKTKIALEALDNFLSVNGDYNALTVSKKDQDISEDLKIHLQQEQNYVLLVDDANRQLINFKQILGVFKENRKGKIKLIITVREYALSDVINECIEYDPQKVVLSKFTDAEITTLIENEPFEIKNSEYQKKIVEVADGNARLAVMAARIARNEQEIFLFGNVSDLYDTYFETFIKDFDIFQDKTLIKTLGIISFFFTIDRRDKAFMEDILKNFEITYNDFHEAIDELEKRELIEVKFNHARVAEQVMATYFFYKVFIKDEILSFKTLLFSYFDKWTKRFSDSIIPANNAFGYENVLNKINVDLDEFLNSISLDEKRVMAFFTLFWFYKPVEMLSYFHNRVKQLPEPANPIYDSNYDTNAFVWDKDNTVEFVSKLFRHYTNNFIPSIELAFEYCRKKPEAFPELIKTIRENLLFEQNDHIFNFQRQVEFFNHLIKKATEKEPHYLKAFFALSRTFLAHHYQITKGGRNHTVILQDYPLPDYEVSRTFRKKVWTTLFENYKLYPQEILLILRKFQQGSRKTISSILEFDLSLILPFIETNLDPGNFEHCHFVYDFVSMLDREKLSDRNYRNLKTKFASKQYDYYRKLDWNTLKGREDYEFENYEEFEKLKEQDILAAFIFQDESDFPTLYSAIKNTLALEGVNQFGLERSLNLIVEENFKQNNELGFKLLKNVITLYPVGLNPFNKSIELIVTSSNEWSARLWEFICSMNNEYQLYWKLSFFDYLPTEFASGFYRNELIKTIKTIDRGCNLHFRSYEKFIPIKSTQFRDQILDFFFRFADNWKNHFIQEQRYYLGDFIDCLCKN